MIKNKQRVRKILWGTVAVLGFVILLGTAGSSDIDVITIPRIYFQSGVGMALFCIGVWLGDFI